jgi:hypothetical protein
MGRAGRGRGDAPAHAQAAPATPAALTDEEGLPLEVTGACLHARLLCRRALSLVRAPAEWLAEGRDKLLAEVARLGGGKAPDAKAVAEAKGAHAS